MTALECELAEAGARMLHEDQSEREAAAMRRQIRLLAAPSTSRDLDDICAHFAAIFAAALAHHGQHGSTTPQ